MSDEVLIVGGGFAGLAAGVRLASAGRRVWLLEEKPYLGGRARSFIDPASGALVDNGQHIVMGCYRATIRFLTEIGTLDRIRFQPRLEVAFVDTPGRVTSLSCPDLPSPWHLLVGAIRSRSFTAGEKIEILRLGRALDSGRATRNGFARASVDEWLAALGQSERLRRNFWDLLCIAAMNESPKIAAARLFERVLRLALFSSAQDSRIGIPRAGLSDCYTEAAQAFVVGRGGRVELGRHVTSFVILGGDDRGKPGALEPESMVAKPRLGGGAQAKLACTGVELADGQVIEAHTVISAVPWYELARLLPSHVLCSEPFFGQILRLRPSPIISINLWFDRPVTDLEFAGLRGTTIQWLFRRHGIRGAGENCVSLVLSGAREHAGRRKEELIEIALRDLSNLLPASRSAKLVHSLVLKERFATFSPTVEAEAVRPPACTPVENLYFAGDWTATGLPATIEGAVQSGYTAAEQVLVS